MMLHEHCLALRAPTSFLELCSHVNLSHGAQGLLGDILDSVLVLAPIQAFTRIKKVEGIPEVVFRIRLSFLHGSIHLFAILERHLMGWALAVRSRLPCKALSGPPLVRLSRTGPSSAWLASVC